MQQLNKNQSRLKEKSKKWSVLQSDDQIDIVAPASKCPRVDLDWGVMKLNELGFRSRVPRNIFGDHILHAHQDEVRAEQLYEALSSQDSKAVWCVRGGYGSMKLLPFLKKQKIPKTSKVFLGLSDITSLHVFLNQVWGWPTLHAPILSRIGAGNLPASSTQELFKVLGGKQSEVVFKKLKFLGSKSLNDSLGNKKITGILKGGNLKTLLASLGTPYELEYKNAIVFLEDVGERGYCIDRMVEQLIQSQRIQGCLAIVLGDFTEGNEPDGKSIISKIWQIRAIELAEKFQIPVFSGIPAGHGRIQRVLPLGVPAQLSASESSEGRFELTVQSGGF
jgi:muramoyltetrapeptide carboxypeptidase